MKTTKQYPYTEAEARRSINDWYARHYGIAGAWEQGARGWNTGFPQPAIACTFVESPRTSGAYREIPYGNLHRCAEGKSYV